ncbi:MAG: gliding motility-associated C-terminal domain-containing protein [Bacteroidota bacterium]|nr:gliding motility-associated C-terminal domain-containing protein [Bacteroidota bacterium]
MVGNYHYNLIGLTLKGSGIVSTEITCGNLNGKTLTRLVKFFILIAFLLFFSGKAFSQNPCGANTPVFNVNLSATINAVWISPSVQRADTCCGAQAPNNCIEFIVTLNPNSTGVIFDIYSGAVPPGALFYQINCGPPTPVGSPFCLSGVGPHIITFCKPGNNSNEYIISAVPNVIMSNDITLNNGCSGDIGVTGMQESTVTWNSVYPAPAGAYNSYLSCTAGCDTVTVTAPAGAPPYVDYVVCGITIDGCSTTPYCDTVRVYFNASLAANITPVNPVICFGSPGVTLTANISGGTPPYSFLWSSGDTTQSMLATAAGTYSVTIQDSSTCPPTSATINVTAFSNPITAYAGPDAMVCADSPSVALTGTVTGVTTGIWMGGSGTFSPSNTSLSTTYTPSSTEVTLGTVTLMLITTNTLTCPPDTDYVIITINSFTAEVDPAASNITCSGFTNGTATAGVTGGWPPFTYAWSTTPVQTTPTAINLAPGTYTCVVTDVHGCTGFGTVVITEPPAMYLSTGGFAAACYGSCTGQTVVLPSGGSGSYTYLWQPGNITTAAATNLCVGMYTITVTDIYGCVLDDSALVTQPPQIVLNTSSSPSYCQLATGSAAVTASGGVGSFSYLWMPGGQTTSSISNVFPGIYTVTVTDANSCVETATLTIANTPGVTASVTNIVAPLCSNSCDGSITAVATGGIAPYQHSWNGGPQQTSSLAANLCAGSYTVIITDAASCQDTATMQIIAPPLLILTANPVNPLCIGQSAMLSASASGGVPSYSYVWSPSGPAVSPVVTTTYTVAVSDNNGCQAAPQMVTLVVNPPLSVSVSGNALVCLNNLSTLTANASGGNGGPYSYSWQPTGTTGNICTDHPLSNTIYTITVTDNCTLLAATATFSVTVPALPVASFTTDDTSGCGHVCVNFTNTTPGIQSALWSCSDGYSGNTLNAYHCFQPGVFDVTLMVTDTNGCVDTLVQPGTVTVHSNPVAAFALGPQPTTILEPNICFTDQSTQDVITWYWNFDDINDQATSTIQNPCHAYSDTGRYCASLIVTNQYGCWATASNCLFIEPYFTLYVPNAFTPNEDGLNDFFIPVGNDVDPDNYEMMIFDRWGNLIFESKTWGEGWNGTAKGGVKVAQIDTYVWKINLKDHAGQRHQLIGHVSIIK